MFHLDGYFLTACRPELLLASLTVVLHLLLEFRRRLLHDVVVLELLEVARGVRHVGLLHVTLDNLNVVDAKVFRFLELEHGADVAVYSSKRRITSVTARFLLRNVRVALREALLE